MTTTETGRTTHDDPWLDVVLNIFPWFKIPEGKSSGAVRNSVFRNKPDRPLIESEGYKKRLFEWRRLFDALGWDKPDQQEAFLGEFIDLVLREEVSVDFQTELSSGNSHAIVRAPGIDSKTLLKITPSFLVNGFQILDKTIHPGSFGGKAYIDGIDVIFGRDLGKAIKPLSRSV